MFVQMLIVLVGSCFPFVVGLVEEVGSLTVDIAFDDQTSTFIIPSGGGFEVIFCPPGRSTNILTTMGPQLRQLATTGHVTAQLMADTQNATLISVQQNVAGFSIPGTWSFAVAFVVVVLLQAFIAGFW